MEMHDSVIADALTVHGVEYQKDEIISDLHAEKYE